MGVSGENLSGRPVRRSRVLARGARQRASQINGLHSGMGNQTGGQNPAYGSLRPTPSFHQRNGAKDCTSTLEPQLPARHLRPMQEKERQTRQTIVAGLAFRNDPVRIYELEGE